MTKWRIIMSGLPVSCRCRIPADQIVIDSASWRQHPPRDSASWRQHPPRDSVLPVVILAEAGTGI